MSRHRKMLRDTARLTGKAEEQMANEIPMALKNLRANLDHDWPIRKRFVAPLEAYVERMLSTAFTIAVRAMVNSPALREMPGSHDYLRDIDAAYESAFGVSLFDKSGVPQ
jgi:hypothetical protein